MSHSQIAPTIRSMPTSRSPLLARFFFCWNWKCALLSATARSIVYVAAMARSGPHGRLSIVLVEIAYVALTAGIYAGLQQRALAIRSHLLGNLTVALAVPSLAQFADWLAHHAAGAAVPLRATVAVSIFAFVSALFHLYVMRRGVFLSGCGRSLADDFRRVPGLVVRFVIAPFTMASSWGNRANRATESEATL
jgi:hypothetical protein